MSFTQISLQKKVLAAGATVLSLALALTMVQNPPVFIGLLGLLLLVFFVLRFDLVFPALLVARSSLDVFTEVGFLIGPMNLNVPSAISLFIDLVGGLYLLLLLQRQKISLLDPVSRVFLFWVTSLLFWVLIAFLNFPVEGLLGLREWTRLFSLLVIYLLSVQLVRHKGYIYLVHATMFSLIVPLSVAYYQMVFSKGSMITGAHRVYGTLAHPNAFSLYLVLFMAIVGWKLKFAKNKLPWLVLEIVLLVALLNAFSIGGVLMVSIFVFIVAFKELDIKPRIVIFTLLVLLIAAFTQTEAGQVRIAELRTTPTLTEVMKGEIVTNSITWRIVNWKLLIEQWAKSPVLGYGLNTSGLVNPWYNAAPHNDYLRFLVELGTIGFLMTMFLLYRVWRALSTRARLEENPVKGFFNFLIFAVFVSWMIGATVDNYITTTTFQFYFWALLACATTDSPDANNAQENSPIHHLPL